MRMIQSALALRVWMNWGTGKFFNYKEEKCGFQEEAIFFSAKGFSCSLPSFGAEIMPVRRRCRDTRGSRERQHSIQQHGKRLLVFFVRVAWQRKERREGGGGTEGGAAANEVASASRHVAAAAAAVAMGKLGMPPTPLASHV